MEPLWVKFPSYPRHSMGWRMGGGEDYAIKYALWFKNLSNADQIDYIRSNPEPSEWQGFYEAISSQ
jgi:hypothetical protein